MQPLRFTPLIKRARWGGTRLGNELGKPIGALRDVAESWELCDHGQDQTVVADGHFFGWTLQRLVREKHEELFGRHQAHSSFPLLLKFLDVQDRLSLQVHPTDALAERFVPGERGKTEAWVIVSAQPHSFVFAGLAPGVDESTLRRALAAGDVEPCLNRVDVRAGDVLYIPAGTVHALAKGVMVAEVQQSSVQTYRLWDWGWVDAEGKPRDLHVERALNCTNFSADPLTPVRPRLLRDQEGHQEEALVDSDKFVIHQHTGSEQFRLEHHGRFRALMTLAGKAVLCCGGEEFPLNLGDTLLIPASAPEAAVVPSDSVMLLEVFLPN